MTWYEIGLLFPRYVSYGKGPTDPPPVIWEVRARGIWRWRRWAVIFAGVHPLYLKYGSRYASGAQVRELGEFPTAEEAKGYCETVHALFAAGAADPFQMGKLYRSEGVSDDLCV